ncbi:MAG: 4Fe-4S dicluster domain-containing protein [Candidatus Omnitrophica bacterium]|nr:4Fe-4S dicluster domain-containing protein [Candidatus Omnitrophota bacterium]
MRIFSRKAAFLRKLSQGFFLLLFIYILWSTTYPLTGALPPETFFRTNPNIMLFTSLSERLWLPGTFFAVIMLLLTLILGRFYCGWICPLGTLIDMSGKRGRNKAVVPQRLNFRLNKAKYAVTALILLAAAFSLQIAWALDPMAIVGRFVSLNLIPAVTLSVEKAFIFLVRDMGWSDPFLEVYRHLKNSFLGVRVHFFANSLIIFSFIAAILASAFFVSRSWCRYLCPLGALYSLFSKAPLLRRKVEKCTNCGACASVCRMGAIKNDLSYDSGECVLCMDCVYSCPVGGTRFSFRKGPAAGEENKEGMGRREFLIVLAGAFLSIGQRHRKRGAGKKDRPVIRPPAALEEEDFTDRCIRCGNCMKVCPTNVIQPAFLESGARGIWTPHLVNKIGYCEYYCDLCGKVCPTEAIPPLPVEKKKHIRLGTAYVIKQRCLAWNDGLKCMVCEEHCPVPQKAIKQDIVEINGERVKRPVVEPTLCIGCGICENKCPARPGRAIKVDPRTAERTKAG